MDLFVSELKKLAEEWPNGASLVDEYILDDGEIESITVKFDNPKSDYSYYCSVNAADNYYIRCKLNTNSQSTKEEIIFSELWEICENWLPENRKIESPKQFVDFVIGRIRSYIFSNSMIIRKPRLFYVKYIFLGQENNEWVLLGKRNKLGFYPQFKTTLLKYQRPSVLGGDATK